MFRLCFRCLYIIISVALYSTPYVRGEHAMTTVLARPLGGYGLSPLIFESGPTPLLGLASDAVETKVRKSPVFELLMPDYDNESRSRSAAIEMYGDRKAPKKVDYETLITKDDPDQTLSAPSTNSYYNADNNMFDLFKGKSMYDDQMPSYKEQAIHDDFEKFSPSKTPFRQSYGNDGGPFTSAIQSVRSVEVKNVQDSYQNAEPQMIDIPPSALPIIINFRTSSSQIQIHQSHEAAEPGEVQQTRSEDQPQYLKHMVTKPVIQEVHEVIMPYRKIIQEVLPVEETIKTVVARGTKDRGSGYQNSNNNKLATSGRQYGGGSSGNGNTYAGAAASASAPKKSISTTASSKSANSKYKS